MGHRDHVGRYAFGNHGAHVARADAEARAHGVPMDRTHVAHVARAKQLASSAKQRLGMGATTLAREESNDSLRESAKARLHASTYGSAPNPPRRS